MQSWHLRLRRPGPANPGAYDGSFATSTYNADSTVAERRARDGLTLSHTYDAANRLLAVIPTGEPAATMAELDAGNATTWDPLSRPTEHRRGDPSLAVAYPSYDLGSRPAGERVGDREALGWAWDLYDRAIETRLPLGVGRNADSIAGFKRHFDTLNHLTGIEALSGQPQTLPLGGTWSWSGGRLWGMTTRGTLGTAVRYGYLGGDGAQPPGQSTATWQLGTMTWGAGAESATAPPSQIWGQFAFGYRGTEAATSDGAKVGCLAVPMGKDLFAGTGWSWDYDAGVRLAAAKPGRGSLQGATEENSPSFRYQYGKADELQKIIDEAAGKASTLETGPYGRILSRDGVPFEYDASGRRTDDDRHSYKWSWRGELVEVKVKQGDFAGHQVKYQYDAQGRLHARSHFGPGDSNGQRLLQEKRAFLWEGQSLLAEAAYTDETETQIQWRKTYVPGPSGLDDAIQVKVENFAAPGIPGSRLYTYLRDELGTVIGIVGEEETQNPANPTIAARYLYNPYGEAHLEKGLEVRQVRFDESVGRLNADLQTIEDPTQRSPGALIVTFAAALDSSSFAGGVVVERHDGAQWLPLGPDQLLVGTQEALELKVLVRYGWERGANYRVRLAGILDTQGRGLAQAQNFEWKISASRTSSDFSKVYGVAYDSAKVAVDTVGGRFPGGQNSLFQGLWTDPVTGTNYARARWFESRTLAWLSEDPIKDGDSLDLYAFVGRSPSSKVDPGGLAGKPPSLSVSRQLEIIELRSSLRDRRRKVYEETSLGNVLWSFLTFPTQSALGTGEIVRSAGETQVSFQKFDELTAASIGDRSEWMNGFTDVMVLSPSLGCEATSPLGDVAREAANLAAKSAETAYYTVDSASRVAIIRDVVGSVAVGVVRKFATRGVEGQLDYLVTRIPGIDRDQARILLTEGHKRGSSVVFGGSRVRGDFRPASDLDVGFGGLTTSQAHSVLSKARKAGGLSIEDTKIVPGNETRYIARIVSPEEFFQRSGIRGPLDARAGEPFYPSGSITLMPNGEIIEIPAGAMW